jgi:hypothetical protein
MDKVIVFGASDNSKRLYDLISKKHEIIAFTDNDSNKWGSEIDGKTIVCPKELPGMKYDEIIVASISAMYVIRDQLLALGVENYKINLSYMELQVKAREQFVSDYAQIVYENHISGSVAEAGVFQGEFAKVINEKFYDRKCYLFDTFEGFDEKDILIERENDFSNEKVGHLNITSEALVLQKMRYEDNCMIRKGYFPDTADGIEDTFCFVNLDMDLYKPTLEGLKFFWDRMETGGVILIHDYFGETYKGVKCAVEEFRKEKAIPLFPIGDSISIAMIKS